jgi:hypothetical protein
MGYYDAPAPDPGSLSVSGSGTSGQTTTHLTCRDCTFKITARIRTAMFIAGSHAAKTGHAILFKGTPQNTKGWADK